ncbi:hypothetical protein K9M78_01070 [Candidatus Bipolaricaulota bacterium]|nr:hypothetical protein [Candidatus Bipolaricaulota bacterium]
MTKLNQLSTATIVFLLAVAVLVVGPNIVASEEDTGKSLDSLNFKIDGTVRGEPAVTEYWFDNINTENELFRMTTTSKDEDKVLQEWIMDKEKRVFYRDIESTGGKWQEIPNGEAMWKKMRNPFLNEKGVAFWLGVEGEETYTIMEVEEGEEEEVKLYEISVNEPIEESTFEPE